MGAQSQLFWTLVSFWAWLLCGPGLTAAIPLVTEWQPTEGEDDYTTTETLPWQTDSDYFEPTTVVVAEMPLSGTEGPQTPFTSLLLETEGASEIPGQNPGSADETSRPPSPLEKEAVTSVPNSSEDSTDPATDGPTKSEILRPEETVGDLTEKLVTEEETLVNASSSSSSLLKGTTNLTKAVSEETATSPILLSKGTPSAFLGEGPEVTELVTYVYSSGNDPALPTVSSDKLAMTSEEGQIISSSVSEGETSLDTATREANMGSGLNPTIRSWEDTTDAILGPNDDTLEPSPDASGEAAPSSSSGTPSSNPEVLPGLIFALPESDAVTTKLIMPSEWPTSDLTSTSDTVFESLEPSELVTVSLQPSPEEKADLGVELAPAKGRGDVDSFTASDLDAEPTATGSSSAPEVSLEGTAEVPTEELEDLMDAEAPDSSPVDGAVDTPSLPASSSDTTSKASDIDFEPTPASPIRLSGAPDSSSQLLEESEAGAASTTQGEAAAAAEEEGSGSANSNEESPLASSSLQPNPSASGTEILNRENVTADLDSGAASSSLNSGMETTNSELADTEAATTYGKSSESGTSSSETTSGAGALSDTETPLPPGLDDEVATEAQGVSGGTALPTSLSDVPSQTFDLESEGGKSSATGVPGNVGSSEDSTAVIGSDVGPGSAAGQEAATGNEGQSGTDLLPSDPEPGPVYATQQPVEESGVLPTRESPRQPPVESAVSLIPSSSKESSFTSIPLDDPFSGSSVSEFDETDPSADGFLASSQPPPESGTDSETSEGTEELEDLEGVNGEETSNVSASPEYESAPAGTGSLTGTNDTGDQDSEADLPSQDEAVTVASDLAGNEETLSSSSKSQDEFSTTLPEAQLGSGDAKETSTSFAGVPDAESGELVDEEPSLPLLMNSGTSEPTQGPSQETKSSATIVDEPLGSSSLENEDLLGLFSGIFGPSSQSSDPTEDGRDEGEDPELVANDVGVTASSSGQAENDALFSGTEPGQAEGAMLPVEQSDTLADGETSSQSSAEEEEESLTNMLPEEESPGSVPDPSGEKSSPPYIPDSPGVQPSVSSGSQGGSGASLPSPDNALVLGTATSEESQPASLPTEGVDIPASGSADGEASQPSPDDAVTAGPGVSEREGQMADPASSTGGEASFIPSAAESQPASPATEGVDSSASGSADGEAPQPSPEGAAETGPGASEREGQMADPASSTGGEASFIPSAAESQPASPSTEGVDNSASESADGEASQTSPDDAAETGPGASEREEQMADSPSSTGGEASFIPSAAESQPASPSTEVVDSSASGSADGEASQPSPDDAVTAGPGASELMAGLSGLTQGEVFLMPSGGESASSSTEGVDSPSSGSADGGASQPSLDGATSSEPGASEGEGQMAGPSSPTGREASLSPYAAESQPASSSTEGEENPGLGSAGGKASLDAAGTASPEDSEGEGQMDGASPVSGKEIQSPETSANEDVSGKIKAPLPVEGMETAESGPAASGEPISIGADLSSESAEEQLKENVGGASLPPSSVDKSSKMVHEDVAGASASDSTALDKQLVAGELSDQVSGITDSSQPLSGSQSVSDNTASADNTGSVGNSDLASGGQTAPSKTSTLGGLESSSESANAGAEIPTGTGLLGGDAASVAEGPKVPIVQPAASMDLGASGAGAESVESSSGKSSKSQEAEETSVGKEADTVSSFPSDAAGKTTGTLPNELPGSSSKPVTDSREGVPGGSISGESGEAASSVSTSAAHKDPSAASTGAQLNPAGSLQLPAGESGPELKAGVPLPSSKTGVTGLPVNVPTGESSSSVPSSPSISGSQASKPGPSATSSISSLSSKSESPAGGIQGASGITKASPPNGLDVRGAASGAGLFPANSAQTTSKKPDADPKNPKKGKKTTSKDENTSKKSSGERGLWLYKLTSRIQANYRQRCLDWLSREGRPSFWNKDLPRCPCSLQQARSDNRFTQIKKGLLDSRLTMLYSSTPNKYGAGIRCLYKNNQLVEGHQEKVWKSYNVAELKLYDWCCKQAGSQQLCDKYHQKRPRVGCDGYRSPVQN